MTAMTPGGDLAEQIRRRREERGLSILAAAEQCGVRWATWHKWEQGTIPQSKHRVALQTVLGWPAGYVDQVLGDNRDPLTGERYTGAEAMLWRLREVLGREHAAELGEDVARQLGAERAREHIRLHRVQQTMAPKRRQAAPEAPKVA